MKFAKSFANTVESSWELRTDAWPQYNMPVVYENNGRHTLTSMRWGVWPWYDNGPKPKTGYVANARDDKLLNSSVWKESAKKRRCLVPADAWLEWTGPKGSKWEVEFRFTDHRPFWIAGLWSEDPNSQGRGFTLVTTKPNQLIASLPHDRMIVILDQQGAEKWMGSQPLPDDELLGLCKPYPETELVREDMPRPQRTKSSSADLLL